MSFSTYTPTRGLSMRSIQPGEASVAKSGVLALNVEDLKALNITGQAVLMTDPSTYRIAIRRARDGEFDTLGVTVVGKPKGTTLRITAFSGALKSLGLDAEQIAGRYRLDRKEDMLVVCFSEAAKKQKAARK